MSALPVSTAPAAAGPAMIYFVGVIALSFAVALVALAFACMAEKRRADRAEAACQVLREQLAEALRRT